MTSIERICEKMIQLKLFSWQVPFSRLTTLNFDAKNNNSQKDLSWPIHKKKGREKRLKQKPLNHVSQADIARWSNHPSTDALWMHRHMRVYVSVDRGRRTHASSIDVGMQMLDRLRQTQERRPQWPEDMDRKKLTLFVNLFTKERFIQPVTTDCFAALVGRRPFWSDCCNGFL